MHSAWWRERLHVENRAQSAPLPSYWNTSQPLDIQGANYPSGSRTHRLPTTQVPSFAPGGKVWPPMTCGYTQTLLPSRGSGHEARYHPRANPHLQGNAITTADRQYIEYARRATTAANTGATPRSSSIASSIFSQTWSNLEKTQWFYQDPRELLTSRAAVFTARDNYQTPCPPHAHDKDYDEDDVKKRFTAGRKLCPITSVKEEHLRRKVYI